MRARGAASERPLAYRPGSATGRRPGAGVRPSSTSETARAVAGMPSYATIRPVETLSSSAAYGLPKRTTTAGVPLERMASSAANCAGMSCGCSPGITCRCTAMTSASERRASSMDAASGARGTTSRLARRRSCSSCARARRASTLPSCTSATRAPAARGSGPGSTSVTDALATASDTRAPRLRASSVLSRPGGSCLWRCRPSRAFCVSRRRTDWSMRASVSSPLATASRRTPSARTGS